MERDYHQAGRGVQLIFWGGVIYTALAAGYITALLGDGILPAVFGTEPNGGIEATFLGSVLAIVWSAFFFMVLSTAASIFNLLGTVVAAKAHLGYLVAAGAVLLQPIIGSVPFLSAMLPVTQSGFLGTLPLSAVRGAVNLMWSASFCLTTAALVDELGDHGLAIKARLIPGLDFIILGVVVATPLAPHILPGRLSALILISVSVGRAVLYLYVCFRSQRVMRLTLGEPRDGVR